MEKPWLVFFDGACHLCSREIEHYKTLPGAERLSFVDIASVDFVASDYGLDPSRVNREMHVISPDGNVHVAVDAFTEIWRVLPRYRKLRKIVQLPWVRPIVDVGYTLFARLRPFLPKRKGSCTACEQR